jgi:hypothetical protein
MDLAMPYGIEKAAALITTASAGRFGAPKSTASHLGKPFHTK